MVMTSVRIDTCVEMRAEAIQDIVKNDGIAIGESSYRRSGTLVFSYLCSESEYCTVVLYCIICIPSWRLV